MHGLTLRRVWFGVALLVWVLLGVAYTLRTGGKAPDDLFITYRYALNLTENAGFVYNPGERVFGLSNPGLGLLLALLHTATRVPIPWLGTIVTGISLIGVAGLLFREGMERDCRTEALLGSIFLVSSCYIWAAHGGAAGLVIFLLLLAAVAIERRPRLAGVLAGLAVWCRPDAALGVGILGILRWVEVRKLPRDFGVSAAFLILLGLLLAWLYFGSMLPHTVESKRLLAELHQGRKSYLDFWPSAIPLWEKRTGAYAALIGACGIVGQVPLFRRSGRLGRLLVLYSAGLAIAYPMLGVPFRVWYAIPTAAALLFALPYLCAGVAASMTSRVKLHRTPTRTALTAALLVPLLLAYSLGTWQAYRDFSWHPRLDAYRRAAEWIREHSEPGDDIAFQEIGVLGFVSGRPIRDLMGLVSPRSLPHLARQDLVGAFLEQPAEFMLYHDRRRGTARIVQSPWFKDAYHVVSRFPQSGGAGGTVHVYRRRPGAEFPKPPRP